jgi:hypothetical protein
VISIRFVQPQLRLVPPEFREGDEVVLAEGTYQGTLGIFQRLREDVKWADIAERNGSIRSHPVAWLALASGAISFVEKGIPGQRGALSSS